MSKRSINQEQASGGFKKQRVLNNNEQAAFNHFFNSTGIHRRNHTDDVHLSYEPEFPILKIPDYERELKIANAAIMNVDISAPTFDYLNDFPISVSGDCNKKFASVMKFKLAGMTGNFIVSTCNGAITIAKGEFVKGNLSGDGIIGDINGLVQYKGQICNNMPTGDGAVYKINHDSPVLHYEGKFLRGFAWGEGSVYMPAGKKILAKGSFRSGRLNGNVIIMAADENPRYIGSVRGNMIHGKGRVFHNGAVIYHGDLRGGAPHGYGILYKSSPTQIQTRFIEGQFKHGRLSGEATVFINALPKSVVITNRYCIQKVI